MWSVISNIAYPIAGYFGGTYTLIAGLVLGLTSGWMHWNRNTTSIHADYVGMYTFSFFCIAQLVGGGWAYLGAGLLSVASIFFIKMLRGFATIGITVLIAIMAKASFNPINALLSLLCFGAAYAVRQWGHDDHHNNLFEDITHSLWHILSAAGYYFLIT